MPSVLLSKKNFNLVAGVGAKSQPRDEYFNFCSHGFNLYKIFDDDDRLMKLFKIYIKRSVLIFIWNLVGKHAMEFHFKGLKFILKTECDNKYQKKYFYGFLCRRTGHGFVLSESIKSVDDVVIRTGRIRLYVASFDDCVENILWNALVIELDPTCSRGLIFALKNYSLKMRKWFILKALS